jgi:hypothetical protein
MLPENINLMFLKKTLTINVAYVVHLAGTTSRSARSSTWLSLNITTPLQSVDLYVVNFTCRHNKEERKQRHVAAGKAAAQQHMQALSISTRDI